VGVFFSLAACARADPRHRQRQGEAAQGVVAISPARLGRINGLPVRLAYHRHRRQAMNEPAHPVLAQGKVRYVGDGVALVIAETLAQAKDAAE